MSFRQLIPLVFYTTVVLCLFTLTHDEGISWGASFALLVAGLLSWGLLEYGLHRFAFHYDARSDFGRKVVYAAHLSHHDNPRASNGIFSSLIISTPVATAYLLLAWIATGSWRAASYLFTGLVVGYFYYEWIHFRSHHRKARLRLFRYLQKYHLLHHHQTPERRFGVTSPLFDIVFGTFSASVEPAAHRQAPVINFPHLDQR